MNSSNSTHSNTRTKSQQKIVIILLFITMGMCVFSFLVSNIEVVISSEVADKKFNKISATLAEIDIGLVVVCLALFFVIKLDPLGILIFAWIEVICLTFAMISLVFITVIYVHESSMSDNYPKSSPATAAYVTFSIMIMIAGLISVIVSILKIIFMFKLTKSLKQRNQEDAQQQYPLI
ncbi:unnamed protein product [Rotaria magnacalcarata]|uniref:Uncharacterized protein n=1 Tax=Rotaria magnacalcarata TaxID=392030 RepID=A0A816H3V4_9BILA|nr:unnamed protein product [Rotaria magnacalcarata]CAF1683308.1 unnamed protein product [Rotaria magnacalcarata]CAF2059201.1 unnamed protein product [Rotaria magnacalcarata]CAF2100851.1 unnamed protein product [Rotaria magnacalcarata]CAF2135310.1 unnamed protein product [Rotaria magnacalcarata]